MAISGTALDTVLSPPPLSGMETVPSDVRTDEWYHDPVCWKSDGKPLILLSGQTCPFLRPWSNGKAGQLRQPHITDGR